MGASKIAALLARYASAAEDPPADALTVVDGNNLAHHLATRCDTYAALDAAFWRDLAIRHGESVDACSATSSVTGQRH